MIEWNGHRIRVWAIAYRNMMNGCLCAFDTMREVKKYIKENFPHLDGVKYEYIAAKEVDGDVTYPHCYGHTKAEAINELKKELL